MENRHNKDYPGVPLAEDGHQSITSITFHQRENAQQIPQPITTIGGSAAHHAHLLASQDKPVESTHKRTESQEPRGTTSLQEDPSYTKEQHKRAMAIQSHY